MTRSHEYFTSSAVRSVPSWNVTPSRIGNVYVRPSSETSPFSCVGTSVARPGSKLGVLRQVATRGSRRPGRSPARRGRPARPGRGRGTRARRPERGPGRRGSRPRGLVAGAGLVRRPPPRASRPPCTPTARTARNSTSVTASARTKAGRPAGRSATPLPCVPTESPSADASRSVPSCTPLPGSEPPTGIRRRRDARPRPIGTRARQLPFDSRSKRSLTVADRAGSPAAAATRRRCRRVQGGGAAEDSAGRWTGSAWV